MKSLIMLLVLIMLVLSACCEGTACGNPDIVSNNDGVVCINAGGSYILRRVIDFEAGIVCYLFDGIYCFPISETGLGY